MHTPTLDCIGDRQTGMRRALMAAIVGALLVGPHVVTAQRAVGAHSPSPRKPAVGPPVQTLHIWRSTGGIISAVVWVTDTARFNRMVAEVGDSLRMLDSLVNVSRDSTEAAAINRAAGRAPVHVSPVTLALLAAARKAWALSGHRYDPTSFPLTEAINRRDEVGAVPSAHDLDSLKALTDFAAVEIDTVQHTVRLPRPGMGLDLLVIARGYALDIVRRALQAPAVRGGYVQGTGSTFAFGRPLRGKWGVAVVAPRSGLGSLGAATLDSGAVLVMADSERSRSADGSPCPLGRRHHR